MKNVTIYDNEGESLGRITIVFDDRKQRNGMYECLSCCETGNSVFIHDVCQKGEHLGKEVKFEDLAIELQNKLNNY